MTQLIKAQIQEDMKSAMRNHEKERLGTIRLILAAIKQREVDERIELSDDEVLITLDKLLKQRRQSIDEFEKGGRADLAAKERDEIVVIQKYLPPPLSADEILTLIEQAIQSSGASSARDMGKVMTLLKPQLQGRADMAELSQQLKVRLAA